MAKTLHDFKVQNGQGQETDLSQYQGKTVLVVNVASKCGFTPQYDGLEALYEKYKDQGFVILGFPCNQFGAQEPGTNADIMDFCKMNYGVTFPVMAKVEVNGKKAAPVYEFLKSSAKGLFGTESIKWNFTKFLVGPDGKVIKRYAPKTEPQEIEADIKKVLS